MNKRNQLIESGIILAIFILIGYSLLDYPCDNLILCFINYAIVFIVFTVIIVQGVEFIKLLKRK